jgi:hypothetical protein
MGDEDPATNADLNNIMTQMEAMMVVIESQKTQLGAFTSGASSSTPPTLVETPDKPSLDEVDPEKVEEVEDDEDASKKGNTSRGHSPEIPHPTSYVSGRHLKCHTLLHVLHRLHFMLLALPIGKITCTLT